MQAILVSSLVLCVFSLGKVSSENTVECPESFSEASFIPSPVDCSKYYVCVHSIPVEMTCPIGLWFDSKLNVCNYPQNVTCGGRLYVFCLNTKLKIEIDF